MEKFQLSDNFINKYKRRKAPFGFNGLGELVYMRTYSRIKENGKNGPIAQGAITSPYVSNMICRKLDSRLYGIAKEMKFNSLLWNATDKCFYATFLSYILIDFFFNPCNIFRIIEFPKCSSFTINWYTFYRITVFKKS